MIVIICAMPEERDALVSKMKNLKIKKGEKIFYHGNYLDNELYIGEIANKEVMICRSGVGDVYATISTLLIIKKYKPELIINLGVAGSLNKNIHVGDVVVADKVAHWRVDVPEKPWLRSFNNNYISYPCDPKAINILKKTNNKLHYGPIVSAFEFIYKKSQVNIIKKYFPEALCGEMEGAAIANTCLAFNINVTIIRGISDETLVNGDYKNADFNLELSCKNAAKICIDLIRGY